MQLLRNQLGEVTSCWFHVGSSEDDRPQPEPRVEVTDRPSECFWCSCPGPQGLQGASRGFKGLHVIQFSSQRLVDVSINGTKGATSTESVMCLRICGSKALPISNGTLRWQMKSFAQKNSVLIQLATVDVGCSFASECCRPRV